MKAIRYYRYGSPDVLELRGVDPPPVSDNDLLVRVRAASINPFDWHYMRGLPYIVRPGAGLSRPKTNGLGGDMAGIVEAVGRNVTKFKPGDEVFGGRGETLDDHGGTLAEYITIHEDAMVVEKPANLTFEQAAAVPAAGLSALQALRDKGNLQPGQSVLVNGAAGGTGTFTVQLAKAFGAEVTGVCSTGNVELVRSIGADEVIDYTREDFTRTGKRYDLLVDNAASRTLSETRRVLAPKGIHILVGLSSKGRWIGPMLRPAAMVIRTPFVSQKLTPFLAHTDKNDLADLREFIENGKITPVIDRTYSLGEAPDAIRYLEGGHAKAKVVITI